MRSPVEIELRMDGKRPLAIRHIVLNLTIILWVQNRLYAPSTLTLTLNPINPRHSTLLISYDYLPELISEFLILSLMEKSRLGSETIVSENTED